MINKTKQNDGIFKSVLMAYSVLLLHVLLIASIGILVIFFRGMIQYLFWIFLGGTAAILVSAYCFLKRMKQEGKNLREMLNLPVFNGRAVEISFLGGMASLKIGKDSNNYLPNSSNQSYSQLENPSASKLKELSELANLLENKLITLEEFNNAKRLLLK